MNVPNKTKCGDVGDRGPCFACSVRYLRRKGPWLIRQILPLRYSTYYFTGGPLISAEPGHEGEVVAQHPTFVNFSDWRMWFGRVFAHRSNRWQIVDDPTSPIGFGATRA